MIIETKEPNLLSNWEIYKGRKRGLPIIVNSNTKRATGKGREKSNIL